MSLGTLLIRPTDTDPKNVYIDVDPSQEVIDHIRQQASKNNPPAAEPGYKWVWHHNHWDKVPIAQTPETPITNDVPKKAQQNTSSPVSAETIRQRNQGYMSEMEGDPHSIDHYNFLKEHPDFNPKTASPELYEKWEQALAAKYAKIRAYAAELAAQKAEQDARRSYGPRIFGPVSNDAGGAE